VKTVAADDQSLSQQTGVTAVEWMTIHTRSTFSSIIRRNMNTWPIRKPKLRAQAREQSSLEAPHCSTYSMWLSLNYFGILFLVASISRFVLVSTTTLNWAVFAAIQEKVYRQSPDGATESFSSIFLAVCRILDKLHSLSNILCTCSIFIKMWAQI